MLGLIVGVLGGVLSVDAADLPYVYDRGAKNQTGLKASDVCLSCRMPHRDHPAREAVEAWRPTRVEWSYINDPGFIRFVNEHGALFVGTLNTLGGEGPEYDAERFDGTRMVAPWMTGFNDRGGPGWNTVNKPKTLEWQLDALRAFAEQGVYTFQHDDWAFNLSSYSWGGGDFSAASLTQFAQYLGEHANEAQRQAAGVASWDGFDYRVYLKDRFGWTTEDELRKRRGEDPLNGHWCRFHLHSSRAYFERLLTEGARMAGRPLHLTVNAHLNNPASFFLLDRVDYMMGETDIAPEFDPAPLVCMMKLADALAVPQVVSPRPRGELNVRSVRQAIALTYALGHRMLIPWDVWAGPDRPRWFGTLEEYGDLYDFIRGHTELLDGYRPYAEVALVVSLSYDPKVYAESRGLAQAVDAALRSRGIPSRYAAAGEVAGLIRVPLDATDFEGVQAVAVCGGTGRWAGEDIEALDAVEREGVLLRHEDLDPVLAALQDVLDEGAVQVDGGQVWALPRVSRAHRSAPLVVHLVNLGEPSGELHVSVADRVLGGRQPRSAALYAPGDPPQQVAASSGGGPAQFTVPGVDVWAVLAIE